MPDSSLPSVVVDAAHVSRLLSAAAAELLAQHGLSVRIEIAATSPTTPEALGATVEAALATLAPAPAAFARLQQLAALGEMAEGVAHEAREVVTGIVSFAQLARRRAPADTGTRHAEVIERESLRAAALLDRYLHAARADEHEQPVGDTAAAIRRVTAVVEPQLGRGRIALVATIPATLPAIGLRSGELHQVLLNLLVNAMHATPQQGRITLEAQVVGSFVEIAISDTGPGVPPELRERIFEPFFTTKRGQRTGLGLALCRRVVEAAGGALRCEASATGGACFITWLPVLT